MNTNKESAQKYGKGTIMKKTLFIIIFVLCFSNAALFAAPSNWAENDILQAQKLNLTPERVLSDYQTDITREEFSEMIVLLYESLSGSEAQPIRVNPFSDTENSEILKAYNLGIVSGIGGGLFAPKDTITREQIAVMYYRTLGVVDSKLLTDTYPVDFSDKSEINDWAYDAIGFMNAKGILGGVGNNKVSPKGTATREQAIALTNRTHKEFFVQDNQTDAIVKLTPEQIGLLASSVVKINVEYYDGSSSTGSGFFYDKGKIATNFHVVKNAKEILIEYEDGTLYNGDVFVTGFSTDYELDLATLLINDMTTPYLELDEFSSLNRGQKIFTIGSPQGFKNSLSDGIVSAVRDYEIQITAPISPGSSGGVLLDEFGKVVGVTTWGSIQGENLGFAIPISKLEMIEQNETLTLDEFNNQVDQKPTMPAFVLAVESGSNSAILQWENTGADYYLVFESINGSEYQEIVDSNGYNEWYWSEYYSIEISGYTDEVDVNYAVASVINGEQSEFSYSNYLSFQSPLPPAYVVAEKINSTTAVLQWENTGADYYVVYESINGSKYIDLYDSNGQNQWEWYDEFSLEISGYSNETNIIYAVASVINGKQSDFSYSKSISF